MAHEISRNRVRITKKGIKKKEPEIKSYITCRSGLSLKMEGVSNKKCYESEKEK